jgi:serine O-acetyltransferase
MLRDTLRQDFTRNPSRLVRALLVNYRVGRFVAGSSLPSPVKRLSRIVYAIMLNVLLIPLGGGELHTRSEIGPGLRLSHRLNGTVIHPLARLGKDVTLFHQVTIGGTKTADGSTLVPVIGDNVTIYPGAKVLGGVIVGDNAVIGANAVVMDDVPEGGLAVADRARVIHKSS